MFSSRGAWNAEQPTLCRRRLHTPAFCEQPASIHPAVPRQPTCSMQEHAAGKGPHTAVLPSWLRPVAAPSQGHLLFACTRVIVITVSAPGPKTISTYSA